MIPTDPSLIPADDDARDPRPTLEQLYRAALGGGEDTVLSTEGLPSADESDARAWRHWPTELPAYEAFVRHVLSVAGARHHPEGQPLAAAVIDWVGVREDDVPVLAGDAGWVDPSPTTFGTVSLEIDAPEELLEEPLVVTRRRRRLSFVSTLRPSYRDDGGPTFWDSTIEPLVDLAAPNELEDWLDVFFAAHSERTIAWVARYGPGPRARRAARRYGVRLRHLPLASLPTPLVARHRAFRFLAATDVQWRALRRRLGLEPTVAPDWSPAGRVDVRSLTEGRRAPEVLPALAALRAADVPRFEARLLAAVRAFVAHEDVEGWDAVAAGHRLAEILMATVVSVVAGEGADAPVPSGAASDEGAARGPADTSDPADPADPAVTAAWHERVAVATSSVAASGDLGGLAYGLMSSVVVALERGPWTHTALSRSLTAQLLFALVRRGEVVGEDVPAAPSVEEGVAALREALTDPPPLLDDLGPAMLARLFVGFRMDDAWCLRAERHLTWWPHRLPQTVRAQPPAIYGGMRVVRLEATAAVLRDVPDTPAVHEALATLNAHPMMHVAHYDPHSRRVTLRTAMSLNPDNYEWLRPFFELAVAVQAAWAHAIAEDLAADVGGEPDVDSPVGRPPREEPDPVVAVVTQRLRPAAEAAAETPPIDAQGWAWLAGWPDAPWQTTEVDANRCQADLPFEGADETPGRLMVREVEHPRLGRGVVVQVGLPLDAESRLAEALNRDEIDLGSGTHLLGAWDHGGALHHDVFLPWAAFESFDPAARPVVLLNLVLSSVTHAQWAWRRVGWRRRPDVPEEAIELAERARQETDPAAALALWQRCARTFAAAGDANEGRARLLAGLLLMRFDRYAEAREELTAARPLLVALEDGEDVARCDLQLGLALQHLGHAEAAREAFEAARRGYEALGETDEGLTAMMHVATALHDEGRFEAALYVLERVREAYAAAEDEAGLAWVDLERGVTLESLRRYEESLECLDAARVRYAALGDEESVANCHLNAGIALRAMGDFGEALARYQQARAIYLEHDMAPSAAHAENNVALVLADLGRFDEALAMLDDAATIYAAHDMERRLADNLAGRGSTLSLAGRQAEALTAYAEAEAILEALERQDMLADCWDYRAIVLNELGRRAEAVALHERALAVYRALGLEHDEAICLRNLGDTLLDAGRPAEALPRFDAARALDRLAGRIEEVGRCDNDAAFALADLGRVDEALARVAEARAAYAAAEAAGRGGWAWNAATAPRYADWAEARALAARGDAASLARARERMTAVVQGLRDGGVREAKSAARATVDLADVLVALGEREEAARVADEARAAAEAVGVVLPGR